METVQARETEIYWLIYRTKRLVIMWKSIHSLLLPLVLISGSLVTCEPINLQPEPSPSITSSPSNTDQGDLKKSFDEVQKINDKFQRSLKSFMNDVVAAKDDPKKRESVNSSQVNQILLELEKEISSYKKKNFQTRNQENLQEIFNDINQNINNIKQITEELKDGLDEDKIINVLTNLVIDINSYQSYSYPYDYWGPETAQKINESLTTNSEQLKAEIIDIGLVLIANKNEAEINKLKDELKNISNELNEWKYSILILGILVVIIILALIAILIELFVNRYLQKSFLNPGPAVPKSSSLEKSNKPKSQRGKKLTQVTSNTLSSTRSLETREKSQNKTTTPQQNQQVEAPDNNADNVKFIVKEEINRQLSQAIDKMSKKLNDLQNKISEMLQNQQLKTPDNLARGDIEPGTTTNSSPSQVTPEPQIPDHQYSGSSAPGLILTYQQNPRSLLKNAIEVSETDHSIDQRRLGDSQGAILQKVSKGNYCILDEGGVDYMVPKNNIRINPYNLNTVEHLFECQGYQPGYSGFQLIKPARVSTISRGEVWQLVERGILQFS